MNRAAFYISLIVVLGLTFGCSHKNEPGFSPDTYGEDVVCQWGDSALYLCRHEWQGLVLGEVDPASVVAYTPWRVPTKQEGVLLHKYALEHQSSQRYLCRDEDGVWWSFLFGSGNVTKAGMKTKYALRPVRVAVMPTDTVVNL